jgi:transglutaminase-like putative cysteine protease
VSAQDRAVDLAKAGHAAPLSDADRRLYTSPTALIPTDGIVKQTSDKIVAGATAEIDKARRIYEWVVENSHRDPKTRGCGIGDIAAMLRTNTLSGKCADLNALYVGLARAAGLPARDVYGLRVVPSKFGYKSLGAGSANVTKAQHCRAEVYISSLGWVPVDPADVRKVVLEEPPANLPLNHPAVVSARAGLFGSWEGNWLAYNFAHDVALPGATGPALAFLMYPQAEVASLRLDCLDPDTFKYTITASEVSV